MTVVRVVLAVGGFEWVDCGSGSAVATGSIFSAYSKKLVRNFTTVLVL